MRGATLFLLGLLAGAAGWGCAQQGAPDVRSAEVKRSAQVFRDTQNQVGQTLPPAASQASRYARR